MAPLQEVIEPVIETVEAKPEPIESSDLVIEELNAAIAELESSEPAVVLKKRPGRPLPPESKVSVLLTTRVTPSPDFDGSFRASQALGVSSAIRLIKRPAKRSRIELK